MEFTRREGEAKRKEKRVFNGLLMGPGVPIKGRWKKPFPRVKKGHQQPKKKRVQGEQPFVRGGGVKKENGGHWLGQLCGEVIHY